MSSGWLMIVFFFFQAEDGIRDHCVTGVQTCALPILGDHARVERLARALHGGDLAGEGGSEERRGGKSVDLGGRRIIKKKKKKKKTVGMLNKTEQTNVSGTEGHRCHAEMMRRITLTSE